MLQLPCKIFPGLGIWCRHTYAASLNISFQKASVTQPASHRLSLFPMISVLMASDFLNNFEHMRCAKWRWKDER